MEDAAKGQVSLRARGQSEARAVGSLLLGAAALVSLSLALPHPSGGNTAALIGIAALMAVTGVLCLALFRRVPLAATHLILAATVAATGLLFYESGIVAGQYGSIFVWATLVTRLLLPPPGRGGAPVWLLVVYAVSLAAVESTAGYSPLTRWLFTGDLADRGDALHQRHRRPPRPRRRARPPLLRPLPRHALHDGPGRALRRGQRRLDRAPRLRGRPSCRACGCSS